MMLTACRENNCEEVERLLTEKKNIEVVFEKDGWSPLLWAACNGNEDIVRRLIKHDACSFYNNQKQGGAEAAAGDKTDENYNPFVKQPDPKKYGRYNPLHWASYKGFYKVVWLLLKEKMSPLDVDQYGNTAVHQAAASKNIEVLKCFLAQGVDVNLVNSRNHTPMELATEAEHKKLISKALKTKQCENCKSKFDFKNIRYFCEQSDKFYCINCCSKDWVYETAESDEKERPICRGHAVSKKIKGHEEELRVSIETNEFFTLDKSLNNCSGVDIDVKIRKEAETLHLKLDHELRIRTFLTERSHHDSFKDIRKDVQKINDMVQAAQDLEIDLDPSLIGQVNQFTSRLISERNLRKRQGLYLDTIQSAGKDNVKELSDLISDAKKNAVEGQYITSAEKLTSQMSGNIESREILDMFLAYPEREYPEEIEIDPKKAKDKKAKPKKKKKQPQLQYPPWGEDLDNVRKTVDKMKKLIADKVNLKLEDSFVSDVEFQIKKMTKEINFRQQMMDIEAQELAEKLAKKKAKKK